MTPGPTAPTPRDGTGLTGIYGFELKERVRTSEALIQLLRDEAGLVISDRLARLVPVRDDRGRDCRHLQNGPAELDPRIHGDNSWLRRFFSGAPSTAGERIQPCDESILVPLDALEVQSDQIAHRELAVSGCIDHIPEACGFNEQVLAVREHLVMNQGVRTPEVLTEVVDGATNLRQLDLGT